MIRLAAATDRSVPAGRAYVHAMLGFQVYANHVHQALHTEPHGEPISLRHPARSTRM